jgi:hypothetical protein
MNNGNTISCKNVPYLGYLYRPIVNKEILKILNKNIKTLPNKIYNKVDLKFVENANINEPNKIITLIALQPSTILARYTDL